MQMRAIDLAGQTFGLWKVVSREPNEAGHSRWLCVCECGNTGVVYGSSLQAGKSKCCGCKRSSNRGPYRARRDGATRGLTHGHAREKAKTPTYYSWRAMFARCTNPNHKKYDNYGGRGIKICDRWKEFTNFLNDLGERPPGTTLDRIDSNGNYEPGNCRWATQEQQVANRRKRRYWKKVIHN
jgi:hypothetical protein